MTLLSASGQAPEMRFGMKKLITMSILAGLILMTVVISSAQEGDIANGILAGVEAASPVNWNSDIQVWKTGKIDFINSDGLVVEDTRYFFSAGTHFFSADGLILNLSSFDQGAGVTFVLDSDRKTIVKLIYGIAEE